MTVCVSHIALAPLTAILKPLGLLLRPCEKPKTFGLNFFRMSARIILQTSKVCYQELS